jgi:hypothetical protein
MSSSTAETREALAVSVKVSEDTLSVELSDGRTVTPAFWRMRLRVRFVSPLPVKGSRIRQNSGRHSRILANAATSQWRRTEATHGKLSTVTAITTGAVSSSPLTNSIVAILSMRCGLMER